MYTVCRTLKNKVRYTTCVFVLLIVFSHPLSAQTVTIQMPTPNQPFCGDGPITIPVLGTVPEEDCENVVIDWSVTIEGQTYTTTTNPGESGMINVPTPPTQNSSFGNVKVRADARATSTQQFSGTGEYFGFGALQLTVRESGQNFEGYILDNCDDDEQDMVIGEPTNNFQAGTSTLIQAYCTDAEKDIPSPGQSFSAPWTSESTSHWAYWERQATIFANQHAFGDETRLLSIWYISDRSGEYNEILSGIGYPPNGPTKNFDVDVTPPSAPVVTDDGDLTFDSTQLHAKWVSEELESGIVEYEYAIGTTPGGTNVVNWTSAGGTPEVTHSGLNLEIGTSYYFAVKARNGAGLLSESGFSDGIVVAKGEFSEQTVYNFPNPFSPDLDGFTRITFVLEAPGEVSVIIFDASGGLVWEEQKTANQGKNYLAWDGKNTKGETVANGIYFCRVEAQGKSIITKIAVMR